MENQVQSPNYFLPITELSIPNMLLRKKIFVIDDDREFRLSICDFLVTNGFCVNTAKDGEDGIITLTINEFIPDLIILDLIMPNINGLEVKKKLLAEKKLKHIPVMFLTGFGIVEGETCVEKPYDKDELLNIINYILKKRTAH